MFEHRGAIVTVAEAAEELYVSKNRIYELLHSGELKGFRMGKNWKIPSKSLEEYVRTQSGLKQ